MRIITAILRFILSCIASLTFRVIYVLSNILNFSIYYIIRYRKTTVFNNLSESFPEKNQKEIKQIAKRFYRNFSDLQFEVIKSYKMTKDQLNKRVIFKNQEIIDELYK